MDISTHLKRCFDEVAKRATTSSDSIDSIFRNNGKEFVENATRELKKSIWGFSIDVFGVRISIGRSKRFK